MIHDVVVIGGGPAGSAAAMLLADWGRSVQVLTREMDARADLALSLPPSIKNTFDRLGVRAAVDGAGFMAGGGNTVWWESRQPRVEPFLAGATGYQLLRSGLEDVLLQEAQQRGVTVVHGAVRQATPGSANQPARVECGGSTFSGRWILDCSGRAGVIARNYRVAEPAGRTLAIAAAWRWPGDSGEDDSSHTWLESYVDGWMWSIPVAADTRHVTVMVDPRHTELPDQRDTRTMYEAELAKSVAIRPRLESAELASDPVAADASWYRSRTAALERGLLVGDASSFIDPLSSYGVKKALASAYVAAVVTNTGLEEDDRLEPARQLYDDIENRMFESARRAASTFFREGGNPDHAFWADRAGVPTDVGGEGSQGDIDALKVDPEVLAEFERLRRLDRISVRLAPEVRTAERPIVGERFIEYAPHLVNSAFPGGVRYLRNVNLPGLVEAARGLDTVPAVFDRYQQMFPPVILPDFLGALSVMVAKGLVEPLDSSHIGG